MKNRNLLSGFALAALMALGITTAVPNLVHAQQGGDWTCDNGTNPVPDGYDGSVDIQPFEVMPGPCVLGAKHVTGSFSASGWTSYSIGSIQADNGGVVLRTGGPVTAGSITAGTNIEIDSTVTPVTLGALTAGTTGSGAINIYSSGGDLTSGAMKSTNGNIFVESKGTIKTPSITTSNGDIRAFANWQQPSGAVQKIGTGGIGAISITSGNGNGIYVSNPYNIDYSGPNVLQPNISSNPGGYIVLDTGHWTGGAPDGTNIGTVTMAGSLNVDDTTRAGFIDVFASEIIAKGATVSASSPNGQVGTINLVTNKISNRSGLTVNVNGNNSSQTIDLSIFPIGSYGVASASTISLPIFYTDYTTSTNPLDIVGAGTLTIGADGNNNGIKIFGYPLKISPMSTTISNKGSGNLVTIQGTDGGSQPNKLTWGGVVQIHDNNTATSQTPNLIEVKATNIPALTDNVLLDASGLGGADGSNISLTTTGGALSLGGSGSNMTLNSNGGPSGGKGGNVTIDGGSTKYSLLAADAITASALSGNGDGGSINLTTTDDITIAGTISTNGIGTGHGGTLSLASGAVLDLTQATLEANSGNASTTGGTILLSYKSANTLTVLNLSALANSGSGGTIQISNTKNADLLLNVTGLLQTSNTDTPSGAVKLVPNSAQQNGVVLAIKASGGFNSVLSTTGQSVTVTAEPVVTLGLDQIEAKSGDVDISSPDCGTVCVAAAGVNQFAPSASLKSKAVLIPSGKVKSAANLKMTVDTVINNGTMIGAQSITITAANVINNGKISSPSDKAPIVIKARDSGSSLMMTGDGGTVDTPDSGSATITIDGGRLNSGSVLTLSGNQTFTTKTLTLRAAVRSNESEHRHNRTEFPN